MALVAAGHYDNSRIGTMLTNAFKSMWEIKEESAQLSHILFHSVLLGSTLAIGERENKDTVRTKVRASEMATSV